MFVLRMAQSDSNSEANATSAKQCFSEKKLTAATEGQFTALQLFRVASEYVEEGTTRNSDLIMYFFA